MQFNKLSTQVHNGRQMVFYPLIIDPVLVTELNSFHIIQDPPLAANFWMDLQLKIMR